MVISFLEATYVTMKPLGNMKKLKRDIAVLAVIVSIKDLSYVIHKKLHYILQQLLLKTHTLQIDG
jgi:hypothetical protein